MNSTTMPCPECGFGISISLEAVLYNKSFSCPSCLTQIKLEQKESKDVIEYLKSIENNMD